MADQTYRFYIRQGEFELDLEGDQEFVESYLEAFFEGEAAAIPQGIEAATKVRKPPAKKGKAAPKKKASPKAPKA